MQYDLFFDMTDDTFFIECSLANKPKTLADLTAGIESGTIKWQYEHKTKMQRLWNKLDREGFLEFTECILTDDFRTQKPIRHNINWIPIERGG